MRFTGPQGVKKIQSCNPRRPTAGNIQRRCLMAKLFSSLRAASFICETELVEGVRVEAKFKSQNCLEPVLEDVGGRLKSDRLSRSDVLLETQKRRYQLWPLGSSA